MQRITSYLNANAGRLLIALALCALALAGALEPTAALAGGVLLETSPVEQLKALLGQHGGAIKEAVANWDARNRETREEVAVLRSQILELAQKAGGTVPGTGGYVVGGAAELADLIIKSDGVKAFLAGNTRVCEVNVPTKLLLKTQIVSESGTAQALVAPDRRPIAAPPEQRLLVQGLFERVPTQSNLIEFAQEASFTNNARPQGDSSPVGIGEGETFAESGMTFTLATSAVRTIGHWIPASMQVLRDSGFLEQHLVQRLLYGLNLEIEDEILTGDGGGNTLQGINNQASAYNRGATNDTIIDTLAKSILQAELSNYSPNGIILNPADWWAARLLKDSQNRYLLGDPGEMGAPMVWSKQVISTPSQTAGRFTTIDAPRWGVICDNEYSTIRISDQHSDFFVRGMIAIRAHARLAFVTERSAAAIYGNVSHAG